MKLPTHCYSCGVPLEGGATRHKANCEVRAIIEGAMPSYTMPSPREEADDDPRDWDLRTKEGEI